MGRVKTTDTSQKLFSAISYTIISLMAALCLFPFLVVVSGSLTRESSILLHGYSIIPREWSTAAYGLLFEYPKEIVNAYLVTLTVTIVGTVLGLFLTTMTAFALSLKRFRWASRFSFFFYFTTLFNGGLVPWYILCVKYLRFSSMPIVAQVVPYLFGVFNIIIMRTFLRTAIPESVVESGIMDGASYFRIFLRLVLPLAKPALATIGLLLALTYWNDWYLSFLFVRNTDYSSLQYFLYRTLSAQQAINTIASQVAIPASALPKESMKMAMTVVATGPIVMLYPYVQKYFIKGLTIGSIKG